MLQICDDVIWDALSDFVVGLREHHFQVACLVRGQDHSDALIKYRIHPASCVSVVNKAGQYHEVRRYFLEWFEDYLHTNSYFDDRVASALRKALRPYRLPRLNYMLTLPQEMRNRAQRLFHRRAVGNP